MVIFKMHFMIVENKLLLLCVVTVSTIKLIGTEQNRTEFYFPDLYKSTSSCSHTINIYINKVTYVQDIHGDNFILQA